MKTTFDANMVRTKIHIFGVVKTVEQTDMLEENGELLTENGELELVLSASFFWVYPDPLRHLFCHFAEEIFDQV